LPAPRPPPPICSMNSALTPFLLLA
jgi:hypothetical protein